MESPESPALIFQALREEFPPRRAELQMVLQTLSMSTRETATEFLNRVYKIYQAHQVDLPETQVECQTVFMHAIPAFIKRCTDHISAQNLKNGLGSSLAVEGEMSWDSFHGLARTFDQVVTLMDMVKTRGKITNEMKLLTDNVTTGSRTRSGRVAEVHALDANPDNRGRSQQYSPHGRSGDGSRPRSNSAASRPSKSPASRPRDYAGGHKSPRHQDGKSPRFRDKSPSAKSPGKAYPPGSTPYKAGYTKTPFEKTSSEKSGTVAMTQLGGLNWISVNLLRPLRQSTAETEMDPQPIVFSTLPGTQLPAQPVNISSNTTRRPNLPEGINQEDLDKADKNVLALPEAMRRGLRTVQDLPVQNPYAKILNSHFMLSFRQLPGLCLDAEFADVCKQLLDIGLKKEMQQHNAASSRAAAAILKLALLELPHMRVHWDMRVMHAATVPSSLEPLVLNMAPSSVIPLHIVHMAELSGCVGGKEVNQRDFKLDSGASVSCISKDAMLRDANLLRRHGQLHVLAQPMSLSGFAFAHTMVTHAVANAEVIIGETACRHTFLVVPGLVCDYMLGHEFTWSYSLTIRLTEGKATMGVPRDEWIGNPHSYTGLRQIDIHCDAVEADPATTLQ